MKPLLKYIAGTILSAAISWVMAYVCIGDWADTQLAQHPAQFAVALLISALFGATVALLAYTAYLEKRGRTGKEIERLKARISELEAEIAEKKSDYEKLMIGVQEDAAKARVWLRDYDAQQLKLLWECYRDCGWNAGLADVRASMNQIMNTFPKVFFEEYVRIVGEEPEGWDSRR